MKEFFSGEKILSKKPPYYQTDESPDLWFSPELVWEIRGAGMSKIINFPFINRIAASIANNLSWKLLNRLDYIAGSPRCNGSSTSFTRYISETSKVRLLSFR